MGNCPHYKVLGVSESASIEDIRKAYFEKLRQYPPNKYPDEFQKIRKAYEVLTNSELRELCDKFGDTAEITLDEFLRKNKGRKIDEIGENIAVMGQKVNVRDFTCPFCNEHLIDPDKTIILNVELFVNNDKKLSEPFGYYKVCPQCYDKIKFLDKIIKRAEKFYRRIYVLFLVLLSLLFLSGGSSFSVFIFGAPIAIIYPFLFSALNIESYIKKISKVDYLSWNKLPLMDKLMEELRSLHYYIRSIIPVSSNTSVHAIISFKNVNLGEGKVKIYPQMDENFTVYIASKLKSGCSLFLISLGAIASLAFILGADESSSAESVGAFRFILLILYIILYVYPVLTFKGFVHNMIFGVSKDELIKRLSK